MNPTGTQAPAKTEVPQACSVVSPCQGTTPLPVSRGQRSPCKVTCRIPSPSLCAIGSRKWRQHAPPESQTYLRDILQGFLSRISKKTSTNRGTDGTGPGIPQRASTPIGNAMTQLSVTRLPVSKNTDQSHVSVKSHDLAWRENHFADLARGSPTKCRSLRYAVFPLPI